MSCHHVTITCRINISNCAFFTSTVVFFFTAVIVHQHYLSEQWSLTGGWASFCPCEKTWGSTFKNNLPQPVKPLYSCIFKNEWQRYANCKNPVVSVGRTKCCKVPLEPFDIYGVTWRVPQCCDEGTLVFSKRKHQHQKQQQPWLLMFSDSNLNPVIHWDPVV